MKNNKSLISEIPGIKKQLEFQQSLKTSASLIASSLKDVTCPDIVQSVSPALLELSKIMKIHQSSYSENLMLTAKAIAESFPKMKLEIHSSFHHLAKDREMWDAIISQYALNSEVIKNWDFNSHTNELETELLGNDTQESDLSAADKEQFITEVQDVFCDELNWQQKIVRKYQEWATTNPIYAILLKTIIAFLFTTYILTPFFDNIGEIINGTALREEANSHSQVIIQIDQSERVTIIGDEPYYYLVDYDNTETGQTIRGFVSKRSVRCTPHTPDVSTVSNVHRRNE